METNHTTFESLLKDKLENYELPYNPSDWLRLQNNLPASNSGFAKNGLGLKGKVAAIIGIAVTALTVIYFGFVNHSQEAVKPEVNANISKSSILTNASVKENSTIKANEKNKIIEVKTVDDKKVNLLHLLNPSTNDVSTEKINIISNSVSSNEKGLSNSQQDLNNSGNISTISKMNGLMQNPNAGFLVDVTEGCEPLKVTFTPTVLNDSIEYLWNFGDGTNSSQRNPLHIYINDGDFAPSLTVRFTKSKKNNSYSLSQQILVKPAPNADFLIETSSLSNSYIFTNRSQGAAKILWQLGNGDESNEESVKQTYKINGNYTIKLTATASNSCTKTISKDIKVDVFSNVQFPTAFSPNGDGRNDYFGPIGDNLAEYQFEMIIYNRLGQPVFETKNPANQWNGRVKGSDKIAEYGVYAYEVILKDKNGNISKKTGSVTLVKN